MNNEQVLDLVVFIFLAYHIIAKDDTNIVYRLFGFFPITARTRFFYILWLLAQIVKYFIK